MQSSVSSHFLSALAASKVLYNRAERSQGLKNPFNYPSITFNFQNKLYFQSKQQCRQHALYSHKACYNKPIRILVRMVQIYDWLYKTKAVKSVKPSKFKNHQSLHSTIVYKLKQFRKLNLTLLPEVFKSLIQNLEVKCSVNFSRIMAHKNTRVFSHDKVENKLFKASAF